MSEYDSDPADLQTLDRRYVTRLVAAVSLIALTCIALMLPTPYATMRPGPAFDTLGEFEGEPIFTFGEGVETYPTEGTLDFTTVRVSNSDSKLSVWQVLEAYFEPDTHVVPHDVLYPEGTTAEQSREVSALQLQNSKDASKVAALRALGYEVTGAPLVASVSPDGAAEGVLEEGDVILEVDGAAVDSPEAAVDAVGSREPGDDVVLTLERDGDEETVTITTKPDADDPSVPRIGIGVGAEYEFPIEIENNIGDSIGGPSAGSMFALAIYDQLTPGALTGGLDIAGTGEINASGDVLPIGGVQQKIAGAHAQGAEIFLVPADNCEEAAAGDDHGLKLVKIETLEGAIDSIEALAANPDAKVPGCS